MPMLLVGRSAAAGRAGPAGLLSTGAPFGWRGSVVALRQE